MTPPDPSVIEALKQALDADSKNGPLWLHYAGLLAQAGRDKEAIHAFRAALEHGQDERGITRRLVPLLREAGELAEALIRAEQALEKEDDSELRLEFARVLLARGDEESAGQEYSRARLANAEICDADLEALGGHGLQPDEQEPPHEFAFSSTDDDEEAPTEGDLALATVTPDGMEAEDLLSQLEWEDQSVTFSDVAGLDQVKDQIRLRIIAPFTNPEIYEAFKRTAGGGILLYGPPGCGKTYLARATAGECGADFVSIGIHEILDKYWGETERIIHALFENARDRAPVVLFFDEFDALGSSRGRTDSQFWQTLVNQLLQEMDGIGGSNRDLLVFAATNAPWNVDPAFRRPGRFDRVFLVPPPDPKARLAILRHHASKLPGGESLNLNALIKPTHLMTGADLIALCERASERALSRSLETGKVHPVLQEDFERELTEMNTSAEEWLASARNYARYSNQGGQYDELIRYLKKARRW